MFSGSHKRNGKAEAKDQQDQCVESDADQQANEILSLGRQAFFKQKKKAASKSMSNQQLRTWIDTAQIQEMGEFNGKLHEFAALKGMSEQDRLQAFANAGLGRKLADMVNRAFTLEQGQQELQWRREFEDNPDASSFNDRATKVHGTSHITISYTCAASWAVTIGTNICVGICVNRALVRSCNRRDAFPMEREWTIL